MAFTLDQAVPWGRSYDEYRRMFALSADDLRNRILGCADSPASFNAEATRLGHHVTSCDPLYQFNTADIRRRVEVTSDEVLEQTAANRHEFVWTEFCSVEELGRARLRAMTAFLDDYEAGLTQGRYVNAELPSLPFDESQFDLAVCSHFLFVYSEQFDVEFHLAAIRKLCRVANEVRVFPLLAMGSVPSPHLDMVSTTLEGEGIGVSVEAVPYEFQRGGDKMMRVARPPLRA